MPTTRDQEVQVDLTAFTRVEPPPRVEYRMVQGPFYQVPGRDILHVYPECWGLRKHLKTADCEPLQVLHREWGKSHILITRTSLETWDDEGCHFLDTRDKEEYRIPCLP